MKLLLALPSVIVCLLLLVAPAGAALISDTDLWDASQGAVVDDSSPSSGTWPSSQMFAPNDALFADYQPAGTLHWIEWSTPAPVTIESINLVASHDTPPARDIRYRGFSSFTLY